MNNYKKEKFPFHFLSIINNESIFIWCIIEKMERQTCEDDVLLKTISYEDDENEVEQCVLIWQNECYCDEDDDTRQVLYEK